MYIEIPLRFGRLRLQEENGTVRVCYNGEITREMALELAKSSRLEQGQVTLDGKDPHTWLKDRLT